MASIHILFPKENLDLAPKALQQFQWTMERFNAMSDRNKLAKAARGVLQAIYAKLRKAISNQKPGRSVSIISQTSLSPSSGVPSSATDNTPPQLDNSSDISPARQMSINLDSPGMLRPTATAPDWGMATNFDFTNVAPLFAIGDLIYNDVGIYQDGSLSCGPQAGTTAQANMMTTQPPSDVFGGAFGGDSFWNLMNQYDPPPI